VYGTEKSDETVRRSTLGRLRRALVSVPAVAPLIRPDVLQRDWDLGIFGSCVAIQKVGPDQRSSGWDRAF
jgi:hypothetical protein